MTLAILLDDESKSIYTAGDHVKGRVVLQSGKDEAVGLVTVTFLGRTKTKIRRRNNNRQQSVHRGRGTLFWFSKILYRGHYTLRAERYEWPFEFTFPFEARAGNGDDTFDRTQPFRETAGTHPLPPSFSHHGSGFNTNFDCFVEYKLEASLARPPESFKFYSSPIEIERRLNFLPPRSVQFPDLVLKMGRESFAAKTLRLLPEKADAKLTMKEKMRSTFNRSDLPKAQFSVFISHPTVAFPGGPFPLHLSMAHTSNTLDEKPTVLLRSVCIETKTRVFVRSPGFIGDYNDDDTFRRQLLTALRINAPLPERVDTPSPAQLPDTSNWLYLGDKANTLSLPIEFSTFNIAIFSKMDITVEVACADKIFKMKKSSGLTVLPSTYVGPINPPSGLGFASGQPLAPPPATAAGPSEPLPPPAYEPAPEYNRDGESSQTRPNEGVKGKVG